MKVEVLNEERGFESIKLNLTIESEEELLELWCLAGLTVRDVNELIEKDDLSTFRINKTQTYRLWEILDEIKDDRDIRSK